MYEKLAKNLKKNIEVLENTFEMNNLQILNFSVQACGEDDADCNIYIELATIKGTKIPDSIEVKINLYDKEDELFMVESREIYEDDFRGYDTITLNCYRDNNTLKKVKKGRLYVVKS